MDHIWVSNQISLSTTRPFGITRQQSVYMPPSSHRTCTQAHQPVLAIPSMLSSAYPLLCTINSTGNRLLYFHKSPACHFQIRFIHSRTGLNRDERRKTIEKHSCLWPRQWCWSTCCTPVCDHVGCTGMYTTCISTSSLKQKPFIVYPLYL